MGKRSDFERNNRDFYKTPKSAVIPLLPFIKDHGLYFAEPCAGDGQLVDILISHGLRCSHKSDKYPQREDIEPIDALNLVGLNKACDVIITNPPWEKRKYKGEIFNKLLRHWLNTFNADIWLLFDADWSQTKQATEFSKYCKKIVAVGRVSWMENGISGKDNCSWYCFNKNNTDLTDFYFRESP